MLKPEQIILQRAIILKELGVYQNRLVAFLPCSLCTVINNTKLKDGKEKDAILDKTAFLAASAETINPKEIEIFA